MPEMDIKPQLKIKCKIANIYTNVTFNVENMCKSCFDIHNILDLNKNKGIKSTNLGVMIKTEI